MTYTLNEFQSTLYPSTRHMVASIADEWITAGGSWSAETVAETLLDFTDAELAAECVENWELDQDDDDMDDPQSHMGFNDYSRGDLAAAFNDMR